MKSWRRPPAPDLLLAAAVCLAFGASLTAGFHFDDHALFQDPSVTSPSGWREMWRLDRTRPLAWLTYWLNFQLGGQNPAGYHAVNLVLHLTAAWLLLRLLGDLKPGRAACVAAALFAIHPMQTEPVVYIFARGTLLMTVFSLLAWRAWLRERRWLAAVCFALALLSKEECAALPAFLLLFDWSRSTGGRGRPALAAMAAMALAAGLRVIWAASRLGGSGAGPGSVRSPLEYFAAQGVVILRYFRLLLIPYGFTVDPEITLPSTAAAVLAWLALAAMAGAALRRFRNLELGFWFLGGLILLLPSSSVFPADDLAADRRLYLPLAAFCPALGLALARLRPIIPAAAGVVLLGLTMVRVQVWQTEESLWREALERAPGKIRPRIQLARVRPAAEALILLEAARRLAPDDSRVASELGRIYMETGQLAEALAEFGRALALEPNEPRALNNRAVALVALGQREAAVRDLLAALKRNPCLFDARLNLRRLAEPAPPDPGCNFTPAQRSALIE